MCAEHLASLYRQTGHCCCAGADNTTQLEVRAPSFVCVISLFVMHTFLARAASCVYTCASDRLYDLVGLAAAVSSDIEAPLNRRNMDKSLGLQANLYPRGIAGTVLLLRQRPGWFAPASDGASKAKFFAPSNASIEVCNGRKLHCVYLRIV